MRHMSDTMGTGTRIAEHNVVATYAGPEAARAAVEALERKGVESGDIELFGPGIDNARQPLTNDEQRSADIRTGLAVGKPMTITSAVAAVVGAVVFGGVGWLIAGDGTGVLVGAVGGFIVVGLLGFLYGGFAALPVSEEWGDTFASAGGETSVAVHSARADEIDTAVEALKGSDARRLATFGQDRRLRDVA